MDGRFFDDRRIAKGYAKDRPFLHTQVIDMVKKECIGSRIFQNGLDVGCGAGLSTRALKALCNEVTGIDISGEMIEEAKTLYTEPGYAFRKGSGEAIPFPDVSVDIISGAGMINWTDRNAFLISAGRVLEKRGILFLYDFWISDRMVENDVYSLWWHDSYRKNFPVASGKKEMPWWSDEDVLWISDGEADFFLFEMGIYKRGIYPVYDAAKRCECTDRKGREDERGDRGLVCNYAYSGLSKRKGIWSF